MQEDANNLLSGLGRSKPGLLFRDTFDAGSATRELKNWLSSQRKKARKLQAELEPLVYMYYGLSKQEQALVEDTCEVFDRSGTPSSLDAARNIPTLQPIADTGLEPYATILTETLNSWASGSLRVRAHGGVDSELGVGLVELSQALTPQHFVTRNISKVLATAFNWLQAANIEQWGHFQFLRSGLVFDGDRIYLVKPALLGQWTRTAALNDAVEISARIADARRQAEAV
jgi:hypothetical protein